jgi:hypothetical protein
VIEKPTPNSPNDSLDVSKVPYRTVFTGARIPTIGLGHSAQIDFLVKQLPKP